MLDDSEGNQYVPFNSDILLRHTCIGPTMKIALWQTHPHHDENVALTELARTAQRAASLGAQLVVAPEMTLGGYNIGLQRCTDLAFKSDALIDAVKDIAQRHNIALVVGLASRGGKRPYNSVVAIDTSGREICRYNKTHLYGEVDRAQFSAGDALSKVFDLDGWRVGLAICYDIEFPEVARSLALKGADLIIAPTANMVPFDSIATRVVPTRAEENSIFVAYCNYIGTEGSFTYCGQSCVCGPDGAALARGSDAHAELLIAHLDRDALTRSRRMQTHLSDRRVDLYSLGQK